MDLTAWTAARHKNPDVWRSIRNHINTATYYYVLLSHHGRTSTSVSCPDETRTATTIAIMILCGGTIRNTIDDGTMIEINRKTAEGPTRIKTPKIYQPAAGRDGLLNRCIIWKTQNETMVWTVSRSLCVPTLRRGYFYKIWKKKHVLMYFILLAVVQRTRTVTSYYPE